MNNEVNRALVAEKKLLLIDAYAMIFRAYYAFIRAPRMNSKGENTSAIFGFCVTLEDLLKKINPTHVGVAFDPAGGTFRNEAYEQYNAQRPETPEDIRIAIPIIKDILSELNIPILQVDGFEDDDIISRFPVHYLYMITHTKLLWRIIALYTTAGHGHFIIRQCCVQLFFLFFNILHRHNPALLHV